MNAAASESDVIVSLHPNRFDTVIRWIKDSSLESVNQLDLTVTKTLKRLKIKRNRKEGVKGIPKTDNEMNSHSFNTWLDGVALKDKEAIDQIKIIKATINNRLN